MPAGENLLMDIKGHFELNVGHVSSIVSNTLLITSESILCLHFLTEVVLLGLAEPTSINCFKRDFFLLLEVRLGGGGGEGGGRGCMIMGLCH